MLRVEWLPRVVALAFFVAPAAHAASDADLEEIRSQIRELKSNYEARIRALEQRLKEAEDKAAAPAAPAPAGGATGLAAFNPAVSVVLQGTYANLSQPPSKFALAGFAPRGDAGPGRRGFSLGESELAMSANVDDKFSGNVIVSLSPEDTVSVEEAYGIVTAAPFGLVPKLGRFLSGVGYLNEQHSHVWDFVDAPLAYQAFLGGQYAQDGVQVKWVAPIDEYVELGAEAGNGDRFPGAPRDKNGVGAASVYAHTGGDVGDSHNWRAGVSWLGTRASEPQPGVSTRVAIADFVWKWAPHGNSRENNLKIQGEYFRGTPEAGPRQTGWYAQGAYQFMPAWRIGARYDRLDGAAGFDPRRWSAMLDWSPSEFSRVRLQVAQARLVPDLTDNQVFVQYILSLGAHGAHKY